MSAMAAMSSLTSLDLSYNSIYGNLPKWLGDMSSNFHTVGGSRLEQLEQLAAHALAPGAPAVQSSSQLLHWHVARLVGHLVNLHDLDLEWNELTGSIPTEWFPDQDPCASNVGMNNVHTFDLALNNLEGPLPDGMK